MQGAGNDFIIVNALNPDLDTGDLVGLSRVMCDRNFGVGADGLILVVPGKDAPLMMRMLNPDGSEAEMCGNGIRCFAKYVSDEGLASGTRVLVDTLAGVKTVEITADNGRSSRVIVDMGSPVFDRDLIPMSGPKSSDRVVGEPVDVDGLVYKATCLSMGNPHCVIFVDDVQAFPVRDVGPKIEHLSLFPQRTNVPFVQVVNRTEILLRVWERGAGETLACGTGACAAAIASMVNGFVDRKILVHLPGGDLEIEWTAGNTVLMDCPAENVFTGVYQAE